MNYMLMPLRRYADFQGRSRRREYWMFQLGMILTFIVVVLVFGLLAGALGGFDRSSGGAPGAVTFLAIAIVGVAVLALIIPSIAVQVRRLHDQDRSGWFILLAFIPYIGSFIMLAFMCIPGTPGTNRFGADPKDPDGDLESVFG